MIRHPRILLIGLISGAALLGLVAVAAPAPWAQFGTAYRPLAGDAGIVARVNGIPITEGDLRIGVATAALNNSLSPIEIGTSRRSALDRLIQDRALAAEAAKRGMRPSDAEVTAYVSQVRHGFDTGPTARAHLDEFLAGMGQTADEFFSNPIVRSRYADNAMAARLRTSVVVGLPADSANGAWEAFVSTTRQAARIEVLDPTLR